MKFAIVFLAILGFAAAVPFELSTSADNFGSFTTYFSKSYATAEEYKLRESIFNMNAKKIAFLNSLNDGVTYSVNQFADMTEDEFKATLGFNVDRNAFEALPKAELLDITDTPTAIDWRAKGSVTPVKNQGQCGSCWAFATVADLESKNQIKTGKLVSFSEQNLVDCDNVDTGCNGGLPSQAFDWLVKSEAGKIATEDSYPYKGVGGTCAFSKSTVGGTVSGYVSVSTDEDQIAAHVAANGVVSIGINAGPMQFYAGGIAKASKLFCNPTKLDHGVAIVGFGEDAGKKYWIIKNSWGPSWGEKGYYRIERGTGACGLNTMVTSSKAQTVGC